jgi:hypothetical protein
VFVYFKGESPGAISLVSDALLFTKCGGIADSCAVLQILAQYCEQLQNIADYESV